ncbi:hypothetical protein HZS_7777 [Henneguya salminicola]|nr:hypothetical protein HZS_7777 [Henneguya salminicola]
MDYLVLLIDFIFYNKFNFHEMDYIKGILQEVILNPSQYVGTRILHIKSFERSDYICKKIRCQKCLKMIVTFKTIYQVDYWKAVTMAYDSRAGQQNKFIF